MHMPATRHVIKHVKRMRDDKTIRTRTARVQTSANYIRWWQHHIQQRLIPSLAMVKNLSILSLILTRITTEI